jgi:hypothetical protein
MPGYLLNQRTVAQCPHSGQAQFTALIPQVKVMGQPIAVKLSPPGVPGSPTAIAGCVNPPPPPPTNVGPCNTAFWNTAATKIKVMGNPVLLADSQSTCLPINAPLLILMTQIRVKGT